MATEEEKNFEWQVCWNASTNISFEGKSDWEEYGAEADTVKEVEDDLMKGGFISDAFERVFQASGFEWWLEVREADNPGEQP